MPGLQVSPWRLADDPEAYGDDAGKMILVTPDGEDEIDDTPVFENLFAAASFAFDRGWQVVPLEI